MNNKGKTTKISDGEPSELQMNREEMLELASVASGILVDWNKNLRDSDSWDGEFRDILDDSLMKPPPESGRPAEDVIKQVGSEILPYALRLGHPRCFGFIPSSPTWPGILADYMAAGFNINACTWLVASGPSEVELVVLEWFRQWLGLPDTAGGLLTSGTSAATIEAFVAARESAKAPQRATVYMSDQSHAALMRAARVIGILPEDIRLIPSDDSFRLDIDALSSAIDADRKAGKTPTIVAANAGTTGTGAVDPLPELADFCEAESIWFHVDAAYGGFAVVTDRGKTILQGIERADSITLDGHKWFFQPYEVGCVMVKNLSSLENVFSMKPDILQDTIWGSNHPNIANRGFQLSRSARALKIWTSVQTFGMAAFRRAVSRGMELADRAEIHIGKCSDLEQLSPVTLGVVCFRFNPGNLELDEDAIEQINRVVLVRMFWEDKSFISSTLIKGKFSMRICIINHNTTWNDVEETINAVETFGNEALASS